MRDRHLIDRRDLIIGMGLFVAGCAGGIQTATQVTGPTTLRSQLAAGGLIKLPAGTWIVDDPSLFIAPGTVLQGAGIGQTIIKYTGTSHLLVDNTNISVSDLTLDGSSCPPADPGKNCCGTPGVALILLQSNKSTLLRVRIQSSTAFGVFAWGASSTIVQSCQFDDCGRTYGEDALGGGPDGATFNEGVLYDSNAFTNCHGNAIDNCATTGTWTNNSVMSLAGSALTSSAGDIIADGGATVVVKNNTLYVGSIQVYGATSGCLANQGPPVGCQVVDNVIQYGSLCGTPLCPGLYIIPGNTHHGNVIAGVLVD